MVPALEWMRSTFRKSILGLILFASIATFPTLLIPSSPSMWIAGITFGYGYGFLLIIGAESLGMTLPYLIGSLFHHKIHVSLKLYNFSYFFLKRLLQSSTNFPDIFYAAMVRKMAKAGCNC